MRASPTPHRYGATGQAAVEFSLVAFIFFLTMFAAIQFGITFMQHSSFVFAVRDAARTASIHATETTTSTDDSGIHADNLVCQSLVHSLLSADMNPANLQDVQISDASSGLSDDGTCSTSGVFQPGKAMNWKPCARSAVEPTDPIAVQAEYADHFIMPFLGAGVTFKDRNALDIEPKFSPGTPFVPTC